MKFSTQWRDIRTTTATTKMAVMPIYGKPLKNLLLQNQESFAAESLYITSGTEGLTDFFSFSFQMNILWWPLTFLRHGQIFILVAVAILEESWRASDGMQWLFYSGERVVAKWPLAYINSSPAEPGYVLPLQTVQIQISWLLKKPTDLDLHCLSLSMWIYINKLDQVIWLAEN